MRSGELFSQNPERHHITHRHVYTKCTLQGQVASDEVCQSHAKGGLERAGGAWSVPISPTPWALFGHRAATSKQRYGNRVIHACACRVCMHMQMPVYLCNTEADTAGGKWLVLYCTAQYRAVQYRTVQDSARHSVHCPVHCTELYSTVHHTDTFSQVHQMA